MESRYNEPHADRSSRYREFRESYFAAGGVIGLQRDDIDFERQCAKVTEKGGKRRYVVFTRRTARALKRCLTVNKSSDFVFYNLLKR